MVEFKDVTGVTLSEGLKVAWCIGGRYNSGFGIGVITKLEVQDKERKVYNYETKAYDTESYKQPVATMQSLMKGRNNRIVFPSAGGAFEVICIADQEYVGNVK